MLKRVLLAAAALALFVGAYVVISNWRQSSRPLQTAAPPPPEVGIVTVRPTEVPLPVEYAARVVALRDVEVRSLVGGILLRRGFEEGARVKQGQILFQIDSAPYEVARKRAEAQFAQAQAGLRQAEDNLERVEELFRRSVSTEKQRDEATTARDQARATVQLAEAEIASTKLNLGYTEINAPVDGVTALQSPSVGTLVLAQQTVLTTITPLDPAYVSFSFTDEESRAFRALNARREKPIDATDIVVDLQFSNGSVYQHAGKIDTAAQRVDPQTGTIQARVIFSNAEGELLPGQFVRVRIRGVTLPEAIIIPKEAVSQGPQGPYVYVIGEKNSAQVRPIRLGPELPHGWVVRTGLNANERVVVDGVIRVRPGGSVKAIPFDSRVQERPTSTPSEPSAGSRP